MKIKLAFFIAAYLLSPLLLAQGVSCISLNTISPNIATKKLSFTLILFSEEKSDQNMIIGDGEKIIIIDKKSTKEKTFLQANLDMNLFPVSFYFPPEIKDCLAVGSETKLTSDGIAISITRLHKNYIKSTIKSKNMVIGAAVLQINSDWEK
jgi:hypothetical protein